MQRCARKEGRPVLTIDKLSTFVRQIKNDQRINKPSIKVHPVDDESDPETAKVRQGMIRYIEYSSNASIAYDTAIGCASETGPGVFPHYHGLRERGFVRRCSALCPHSQSADRAFRSGLYRG